MSEQGVYGLKVVEGSDYGKVAELYGEVIELGSGSAFSFAEGEVHFCEPSISRVHAVLLWNAQENVYHISNRSPITPTLVNGKLCANARLIPGENVQMGRLKLEVVSIGGITPNVQDMGLVSAAPNEGSVFLGEKPSAPVEKPAWLLTAQDGVAPTPTPPLLSAQEIAERAADERAKAAAARERMSQHKQSGLVVQANVSAAETQPAPAMSGAQSMAEPVSAPEAEAPVAATVEPEPVPAAEPVGEPQPQVLARLQVTKGCNRGKSMDVTGDISIGRSPDCDFVLTDGQVSRRHCSIEFVDGQAYLVNHSTSSTTRVGKTTIRNRGPIDGDCEIVLANRVILLLQFV